jgi:hypothetical protein
MLQNSATSRFTSFLKEPDTLRFRLPLMLLLIAYTVLHFLAGYNLPTPWPDEAHFIWQANAVAEHFSLLAPELNPDRIIFWMPHGYLIILGLVIKLFGLSLAVARTFSFFTALAAVGMLVVMLKRYLGSTFALLLSVPFVLGTPFVACGNIARMESLLLAMILASMLCLMHRRLVSGIALLALTPLIHPSGVPFLIAGLATLPYLVGMPGVWRRPTKSELAAIAFVLIAWGAYALLLSAHWTDFSHDMSYQMWRKSRRDIMSVLLAPTSISLALAVAVGAFYGIRRKLKSLVLLAVVVPAWWVAAVGGEMWYRVFYSVASLCFLTFSWTAISDAGRLIQNGRHRALAVGLMTVAVLAVIISDERRGPLGPPMLFPDLRPWHGMSYTSRPYITQEEIQTLETRLRSLPTTGGKSIVEFYPDAEAFFFQNARSATVQFNCRVFSEHYADWYLVHFSTGIPTMVQQLTMEKMRDLGISPAGMSNFAVLQRDSTDAWYLIPGHR